MSWLLYETRVQSFTDGLVEGSSIPPNAHSRVVRRGGGERGPRGDAGHAFYRTDAVTCRDLLVGLSLYGPPGPFLSDDCLLMLEHGGEAFARVD